MMRGISIFAFFTLSTILVIVLQPGPREDFANQPNPQALLETSRNETQVFQTPQTAEKLPVPDDVIAELKAGVQPAQQDPVEVAVIETETTLQRLQTALNASNAPKPVFTDAVAASPQPTQRQPQVAIQAIAPELRDMSWQTLNALNNIGHVSKAPGQQGSLLNSIVRRSMGHVDGTQIVRSKTPTPTPTFLAPRAAVAVQTPAQKPQRARVTAARVDNRYTVSSGDTLALIAIKLYGSALATDRLLEDNPALRQNPNALRIGQVLSYSMP